jgi:hypothetical protein
MYNNYIRFGNRIFLQRKGMASGASVPVAYANIYVHLELMETYKDPK